MTSFKTYLKKRKSSEKTIESHLKNIKHYKVWLSYEGLDEKIVNQKEILSYLQSCKEKGNSNRTLSHILNSLRKYYRSLEVEINPCLHLQIKGIRKHLPANLLTEKELTDLYESHPEFTLTQQRDKLILSLLIYQALTTAEIIELEIEDLNLELGIIEIRRSKKGAYRKLKLNDEQTKDLLYYLETLRPKLENKSSQSTTQVFINSGTNTKKTQLKNTLQKLIKRLATRQSYFKNARQLRGSRIALWLKEKNLREVQQLAGHRYISSTERYQMDKVEDLQRALDKYHPRK